MSWSQKLITFFADAFRPPWRTTPWIVLIYVVLSVIYNPDSHFNHWSMPDTDDYMRLTQMMNWVHGQSWFDLRMPHLYPPHVIAMHWARLPDIPLAIVYLLLENIAKFFQWHASTQSVALLTAFFVPCVLLAGLLLLLPQMARPLLGRARAGITCFFALLCGQLIFQYLPMRVDHHAYILLGAGAAFFCLQAIALHVRPLRAGILAGLALGVAMWNGAEILPMVVCFSAAFTVLAILDNRVFGAAAAYGASFLATSFILLLIARSPAERWTFEYDAFSFFYVLLAALVAVYFAALYLASHITKQRLLLSLFAVFAGLCGVAALLSRFPDFINGPYAQANPILNTLFFPNIREAIPLYKSWADIGESFNTTPNQSISGALYYLVTRMFTCLIGIFTSLYMVSRGKTSMRRRKLWALYAFFSTAYGVLAMAWQVRVITYAQLFSVVPLVWLLLTYIRQLPQHYKGRKLFAYEVLAVFAFSLFPAIIVPAIITKSRFMPDMLFFLGKSVETPCPNRLQIISYLLDLADRQKKIVNVMAPMDYTPELMFYTPHNFFAAPYHRNDRGIVDMVTLYRSKPKDDAARAVAKKLDLDYILVCKASYGQGTLNKAMEVNSVTLNRNKTGYQVSPEPKDLEQASLGMRLSFGKAPPWLEEHDVPFEGNFALYEVKKNKLNGK